MRFVATDIAGAHVIELDKRADERGYFARIWCQEELREHGLEPGLAQINVGFSSRRGTLRGMHYQRAPHAEVKIARCLRGAVFDVVLDLRQASPTYKQWFGLVLTPANGKALYLPEGCAHGYLTLESDSELMYTTSKPYAPESATGARFDDPAFDIDWPEEVAVVSAADRSWQLHS